MQSIASADFIACAIVLAALVSFVSVYVFQARKTTQLPLPPGPKPLPLIGNINNLPPAGSREWEHWLKHKDLYGPISSVTVLGNTIVIINDADIAFELLEKRSAIYSSRPKTVFSSDLCGHDRLLAMIPADARFRAQRKAMYTVFGTPAALQKLIPLQEVEVHRFLFRVLQKPADLLQHIRTEAGAMILKATYNYDIETNGPDPLIDSAESFMEAFAKAIMPGAWLVDSMPALKHIPAWFPGAKFKRLAAQWKAEFEEATDLPYRFAKHEMANGRRGPSIVGNLCGEHDSAEQEKNIADTAINVFGGGADTSVSTLQMFFLAMTLHPEIQQKAQQEIDSIVGTERLPCYEDRTRLPYVSAIVREALRWQPIGPLGVAHATAAEDVYKGYRIPKGAILMPNVWWFTHDPAVYPDPMTFDPERFVGEHQQPDPQNVVFGFGRRICPGRLFADSSLWLTVARSLAVFDIAKGVDEDGHEIEPEVQFTGGVISHPYPFKATITPRSAKHEDLVREVEVKHPWEKSSAETLMSLKR